MSATKQIKALLSLSGKKQSDLLDVLGMSSKQSLSNKFTNERWSADDLVAVANYCGGKLAFVLPGGQLLTIGNQQEGDEENVQGL